MDTLTIGIAGGTASGKSTVARRIAEAFAGQPVAFLDQDAYYRELGHMSPAERRQVNFDHPEAFDVDLLVSHILRLRSGEPIEKPVYSFVAHTRTDETVRIDPGPVVVVEGILVLALERLRDMLDLKIYVDTDDDVRVLRRVARDVRERGRSLDDVMNQYFETVRPMHLSFVEPSKRYADVIIPHGGHSDAAIEMVINSIRARLDRHR